jgi:hypothetical protein
MKSLDETQIYALYESCVLKPLIDSKTIASKFGVSLSDVEDQLKIGTEVEFEHTDDELIARTIASHHLYERLDYYTKLKQVESN